jgi:hypothetical protein
MRAFTGLGSCVEWSCPIVVRQPREVLKPGTWYRALVSVRGDRAECFLNGRRVFAASIPDHPAGCIGLRTWRASYVFRNIRVTAPDGKVLLEGLPDLQNK